jgi:hypothetical protein
VSRSLYSAQLPPLINFDLHPHSWLRKSGSDSVFGKARTPTRLRLSSYSTQDSMQLIDRIMPADQQTTKINIANLADVMTSFSQFGKIMRCSLKQHYDGEDTSVSATIEFSSYTSAVSAVEELDGATADGLCLHVRLVRVIRPSVHISTKQEAQDESPLLH